MLTPVRILRRQAIEADPAVAKLTSRQQIQRQRILDLGQALIARNGPSALSFANFACAIAMAATTVRRHFPDLHALLGAICRRHLETITAAIAEIPPDAPDAMRRRRTAYLAATRDAQNRLTEAHHVFVSFHHLLPPDELEPVRALHQDIGESLNVSLVPGHAEATLCVLDKPEFTPAEAETICRAVASPPPEVHGAPPTGPDTAPHAVLAGRDDAALARRPPSTPPPPG